MSAALISCYPEMMGDLTQYVERRFPVGEPTAKATCATGERVLTLTSGGIKEEGEYHAVLCRTPEKAAELFRLEFDKYASGKDGVLYWRYKPSVHEATFSNPFSGGFDAYYSIVARLIITNKRALSENE